MKKVALASALAIMIATGPVNAQSSGSPGITVSTDTSITTPINETIYTQMVGGAVTGGGDSGTGGVGVLANGSPKIDNLSTITGGTGGVGWDNGGPNANQGGKGGSGGDGITGAGFTLTNAGTINGGLGSAGGIGGAAGGTGGDGGTGGNGITGSGFVVTNNAGATIAGGNGGAGSDSYVGNAGSAGNGGAGISGTGFTVSNAGTITGGNGGNGGLGNIPDSSNGGTGGDGRNGAAGISGSGFTLTNSGSITGGAGGAGGAGDTLYNSSNGADGNGGHGIQILSGTNTITNSGIITGGVGGGTTGLGGNGISTALGSTTTVTNTGTITGSGRAAGINNAGTLTLNNLQGTGNTAGPLTYTGAGSLNYNIIVNNPTKYGQLKALDGGPGAMSFGINPGSTITNIIYTDVLQGFTALNLASVTGSTGFYGLNNRYNYYLAPDASNPGYYNLVVASNITGAGTVYQSSNLGTTVNPVFDGGTLQVSNPGKINNNFTVNSNNGVIDQNGVASNFTGIISDATGTHGSITIANTGVGGSVTFSGVNTYTGSTTINNGATLALSGSGSIANSSVNNNGKFDVTGASSNVSVKGYTQTSTGTLAMTIAPTNNQQVNVNGTAALAGNLDLTTSSGGYKPGTYTLLTTTNGVSGAFNSLSTNLSSYTTLGYGLKYSANDAYLVFTPNVGDTQQSLDNTASALRNTYALQNSVLVNSFSYDCNLFGANDICVSAGGRQTTVSPEGKDTAAVLIGAYRVNNHVRIGGWVEHELSSTGGTVKLSNNTPSVGLFGAWNERTDGTGAEVKATVATGSRDATITRAAVNTSEAGTGSSTLTSKGAELKAKYGFEVAKDVIVAPYAGVRYTQNNMGGYTETTSATVTAPLTYSALNTNATTALAGVGASYKVTPKATVFGSAGVESDVRANNGTYTASGLAGAGAAGLVTHNFAPINFNASPAKTRPTAMVGASYDVAKNQRVAVTGTYRQEAFQNVSSKTVFVNYTIGF